MKQQFGQFSSFSATQMLEDGVIESIKLNGRSINESVLKKCHYLFYELKGEGEEGGYKVELSFEDKQQDFFCLGKVQEMFDEGQKQVGQKNQSVLSTFKVSNEMLMEMRRLMATKCTVNISGTTFNIFKLVKSINLMKARNNQFADEPAPVTSKKGDSDGDDDQTPGTQYEGDTPGPGKQ